MWKLGIDIDGVLADHVTHLLNHLNRDRCGKLDIEREDISQWNINICGKDFRSLFEEYLKNDDFILKMPVIEGSIEAVKALSSHYMIFIITNRPTYSAKVTYKWLKKNRIEFHSLLVGRNINRAYVGIDILIDDNPYAVMEFASRKKLSILYSQPWNKILPKTMDNNMKNIVRCETWREIINVLRR